MDIVEILLCEGGDVEQWVEPRNISSCLYLDLFSQLSTFISYIVILAHTYMLDIIYVLTLVMNQESY